MQSLKVFGIAFTVLLLTAGTAAAVPGQAGPATDGGDAGPPSTLPEPVPDFVTGILDSINGFLDGTVEALGEAVSGQTPDGDTQPADGDDS